MRQYNRHDSYIRFWQKFLDLDDYRIVSERISIWQVCDEACSVGGSFCGVHIDRQRKLATIHHTRRINEEDVLHELLHVRYPDWSESQVQAETLRLLDEKKQGKVQRERVLI